MKIPTFIFVLSLFLSLVQTPMAGQSCLPDGILFSTQGIIDSFHILYPGCEEIEGDVQITGPDIVHLQGLSGLKAFDGYLRVWDNP